MDDITFRWDDTRLTVADGLAASTLLFSDTRTLLVFPGKDTDPLDASAELVLYPDGRVYRRGRLIASDTEIVEGLRAVCGLPFTPPNPADVNR